jgi:hypothetical protein
MRSACSSVARDTREINDTVTIRAVSSAEIAMPSGFSRMFSARAYSSTTTPCRVRRTWGELGRCLNPTGDPGLWRWRARVTNLAAVGISTIGTLTLSAIGTAAIVLRRRPRRRG